MAPPREDRPFWHHFVAGEFAGMIAVTASFPFDTVKTRLQVSEAVSAKRVSTLSALLRIVRREGVLSLYRGLLFPFFGFGVINSTVFGVNGSAQDWFLSYRNRLIESANRSRQYRARLPNPRGQFSANTMVNVQVPVADTESVLQVPALAIQQDPLGQFVYVLLEDDANQGYRASRRQVKSPDPT